MADKSIKPKTARQWLNKNKALKTIFPGAFAKEDKYFNLDALSHSGGRLFTDEQAREAGFAYYHFMAISLMGRLAGKAIVLDSRYNWELNKKVDDDYHLLIPTRKN